MTAAPATSEIDAERSWYARSAKDALNEFDTPPGQGLDSDEARQRLVEHGPNRLREADTRSWWQVLLVQLHSVVIYLLLGGAVLALATDRLPEAFAVFAVIVVNTAIGFVSEWRASRSMAALRLKTDQAARVRREGREQEIRAGELVPGDLVLLARGSLVPADLRLVEVEGLRINEAPLTGESLPVDKDMEPLAKDTPLAGRRNMAWKGTSVVDGTGEGVVVATGSTTELGRIAELTEEAVSSALPLQKRLDALGRRLALLTIGIAIVVAGLGLLVRRQDISLLVETALALGIAAIPEGLPIVATIALARGVYRMARRNAVVNRLPAVEALGATRVIFTDKTGTLTENRMRLRQVVTGLGSRTFGDPQEPGSASAPERDQAGPSHDEEDYAEDEGGSLVRRVLEIGVLCNSASLQESPSEDNPAGDPTEIALLSAGHRLGIAREALLEEYPELRVEPFESRRAMMATFHGVDEGSYVAVKGAPEAVLDVCSHVASGPEPDERQDLTDETRDEWIERSRELAEEGLRVLAVADKRVPSEEADPYEALRFVGLVGLLDPPRRSVKSAIDTCQSAGIRVEMVTGDQPETARAIARAVGIVGEADDPRTVIMEGREIGDPDEMDDDQRERVYQANIFARVSPEQKLDLVRIYQDRGEVVAMIGDGVNDAPALKKADIGVAMGERGTEAAKEVADMVLQDDAFETIVAAVEEGRVIFGNVRKSVIFMLTTNVAEVMAVTAATVAGWTLPLLPLQILYLNVLTDVFPAMALGAGRASGTEMSTPPRSPDEPVLTRAHWTDIVAWATLLALCVLASLLLAEHWLESSPAEAVTISFLTLAFGKLWFTFTLRNPESGLLRNEVTRNPWVWVAIAFCALLLLAAAYLPGLSDILRTVGPDSRGWALILGMSLIPFVAGQVVLQLSRRARRSPGLNS